MRLRNLALMLGFVLLAQTGCKSCHCGDNAPPPPVYPVRVIPAPVAPIQTSPPPAPPAAGAMLPAFDPDCVPANPPVPQTNPTVPTSYNRLTSWSR